MQSILCCSFKPPTGNTSTHIHSLSKSLDICMNRYSNIFFLRDFNSGTSENYLKDLCNVYNQRYNVKESSCFKNSNNTSFIDLFLTTFILYNCLPSIYSCIRSSYLALPQYLCQKRGYVIKSILQKKKKKITKNLLIQKIFFPQIIVQQQHIFASQKEVTLSYYYNICQYNSKLE